jgi:hypothetical protein
VAGESGGSLQHVRPGGLARLGERRERVERGLDWRILQRFVDLFVCSCRGHLDT